MREPSVVLRLRSDAYYVPVPEGVWIRTANGSFTLRGRTVATWIERLATMLDSGLAVEGLLASLPEAQSRYVGTLLDTLERHRVVRREYPSAVPPASELERVYQQQFEFLRHFVADPGTAFDAVRRCPISVAGPPGSAAQIAAGLFAVGFADVTLADAEPGGGLRDMVRAYAAAGVELTLRGPGSGSRPRHLVGVFEDAEQALALSNQLLAEDTGAWFGVVRGQAMLLKASLPGPGRPCLRCAWRRLVHAAVGVAEIAPIGLAPLSLAAAVLTQDLFRHVSGAAGEGEPPETEGVVVDMTRLSVWRTAIDPDPSCPAAELHGPVPAGAEADPLPRSGDLPTRLFRARCFGPVVSCLPERLEQIPFVALQLRLNPPGRAEPAAETGGPIVVARDHEAARREGALLGVESYLGAVHGTVVGAGEDPHEALVRALRGWAEGPGLTNWADADGIEDSDAGVGQARAELHALRRLSPDPPDIRLSKHPAGLWLARGDELPGVIDLNPYAAAEAALISAIARRDQFPGRPSEAIRTAVSQAARTMTDADSVLACGKKLGLGWRFVPVPRVIAGDLVAVAITGDADIKDAA